jgi:ketosteroid isomerase-like protein
MKTADELMSELADREAIRELPARYCDCLWRKDLEGLMDLFTQDATFVVKGLEIEAVSHGRSQIRRMHQKALSETTPRLLVHNHIVVLHGGDHASGRCYVEVRNAEVDLEWIGLGRFEDEYAKVGGEWKFAVRRHTFDGIDDKIFIRTFMP